MCGGNVRKGLGEEVDGKGRREGLKLVGIRVVIRGGVLLLIMFVTGFSWEYLRREGLCDLNWLSAAGMSQR